MFNLYSKVYCMADNFHLSRGKPGDTTWPSLEESWEIKLGPDVTIYQHGVVAFITFFIVHTILKFA